MNNLEREKPRNLLKNPENKIKGPEVIFALAVGQMSGENGFHMDTAAWLTASFVGALFVIMIVFIASEEYSYRKHLKQQKNASKPFEDTTPHE